MEAAEIQEFSNVLNDIYHIFNAGYGIASLSVSTVLLLIGIIGAIISVMISITLFILGAIPVYQVAKKAGRKYAWLAWIPIFSSYFQTYVLNDVPGDKRFEVKIFNKEFTFENRFLLFWIYIGIGVFGKGLITAVIGILSVIPVVGQVAGATASLLYLVPSFVTGVIEYVYLRDVLDMFKEDRTSNQKVAFIVTILDKICTFGFARVVILYTIMKKDIRKEPVVDKIFVE